MRAERTLEKFQCPAVTAPSNLLGQVEGRTAATVVDWLAARPQSWRDQVRHVAIDMCTVFKSAIRQALPHAQLVVNHFHVVQLANASTLRAAAS